MHNTPVQTGTLGTAGAGPYITPPTNPAVTLGMPDMRRLIESYGMSHAGNVREVNEDHFVTAALQRSVQLRQTNHEVVQLFVRLSGPRAYHYLVSDRVS